MGGFWGRLFDSTGFFARKAGPRIPGPTRQRDYIIALLVAVLAVLARALLDPILYGDHVFVLSLLAVVFVAWQCGFKPALVTLMLSMTAIVYFFVSPRRTFLIRAFSDRVAVGLFFLCGVVCAILGEAQRAARRKAVVALAEAVRQRTELEREVKRRTEVQHSLLQREIQLLESNDRLEASRRQTAEALALLDTFFRNAPVGLAFYDRDMRYVRVNEYMARANGRSVEEHVGKALTEVLPKSPPEGIAAFRRVLQTGTPALGLTLTGVRPGTGPDAIWSLNLYPVTRPDGQVLGIGAVSEDVTERFRAERQLRASEARFRTFVDNSPGPQFIKDAAGRYTLVNRAFERQTGRTSAEVLGQTDEDLFPSPIAARFREKDRAALAAGRPLESEDAFTQDESRDTFLIIRFPLPDGTVGGMGTDITNRKRDAAAIAERGRLALLRAEVSASLASNNSSRAILQRCVELLVRHLDAAFVRIWTIDASRDTLVMQASAGLYTHLDGPHGKIKVGDYKIGRIAHDQRPHLTNDVAHDTNISDPEWAAREGMIAFAGYPLLVEGEVHGVLGLFARQPLSEAVFADLAPLADSIAQWLSRQRALTLLRANEARFRLLTEAIPQMVWNADAAGEITYFNARWREYTGVMIADARGEAWVEAIHADDRERVAEAWRQAVHQDLDRFVSEFRLRRRSDGEYQWFLASAVALRRADGTVDQWIGSLTDIDTQKRQRETLERSVRERTAELTAIAAALRVEVEERKRAEELVQATARELGRSNEELEKFAYVASHDLQEPLRKIQAFGDRLQTRFREDLTDVGRDYVGRMMSSAGRMRRLIDDLLTFSRVTSKGHPFAPVDLNDILADVVSDLEVRIAQTQAAVDVGPLPTIDADPSQIRQLFQNLVANALKFHRAEEPPRIVIRGELVREGEEPMARVTIADNGIGFDIKYLDRIFEVFQRLHGREEYEGTGVGLAICRKIVERHRGTITATSVKGQGATFVVTLPVEQNQLESVPHAKAE